jgi:transcriptional regulator with XRE-family HTH domain
MLKTFARCCIMCDYRNMADGGGWDEVGEQVRRTRLSLGLSQAELAGLVGLDRTMIAKIEAGTRRIDALELISLSRALGVPIDLVLRPLPEVLSRRSGLVDEQSDSAAARESGRLELALIAWLHDVQQLVELGTLRPKPLLLAEQAVQSADSARGTALWLREYLGYGVRPVDALIELCEQAGMFVLVTELPGEGASLVDGDLAVAVVSLRGDPGRRRATAAHELGHFVIGDEYSSDLGVHASREEREAIIDAFAAELLLPTPALRGAVSARGPALRSELIKLAATYRTSWSLAVRQAEHAGLLDDPAKRELSRSSPTRGEFMEALGWAPQPDLTSLRVPPSYAQAVIEAWRGNAITGSRAVELMHGQITEADLPFREEAEYEP